MHGSGIFHYPTADEYEAQLLATVRDLARDAARLAKAPLDSEAAGGRCAIASMRPGNSSGATWPSEQRSGGRRVASRGDLLHARLNAFLVRAEESPSPVALLTWQQAYRETIRWLAHWSGNGS